MTASFKTKIRNVTIIQCYAPTENAENERKEHFYYILNETVKKIRKKECQIIMGDLNAKIGSNNDGLEQVMGVQGAGEMNKNGEIFTNFCANYNLVIGGTLFPHKTCHKITWVSPDNNTENQIDHTALSRKFRRSLTDVRNKRGADINSDHHLVVADF
jgi:endonuclease/exonuclease/phosphatase family metal-dependent hydrolase